MRSAEWVCTKCGTVNRLLLRPDRTTGTDRCVTCHLKHTVSRADRPVRWEATASQ